MKKIIKLTESDLEKIVKRVLLEQKLTPTSQQKTDFRIKNPFGVKTNINPKNLEFGDGGQKSRNKRNDVIALQQQLIDLGLLKTQTGKPTGYFGNVTKKALDKYNDPNFKLPFAKSALDSRKTSNQSQTKTEPEKEKSFFDKTVEFCSSPFKRLGNLISSFNVVSLIPFPVHWRAFMSFLLGRTEPMTASFFKPDELKVITDRVNDFFPKNSKCQKNKQCGISFYSKNTDWSKVKSGEQKVVNPDLEEKIGYTIGNGQVVDNGNSYTLKDIYDFNNFKNHPEAYSSENAPDTIKTALKKIVCGNWIQGLEELASFKQSKGYKGIPVEIEIPKTS